MFKDILREQQPVVYHTLRNALEHNRLAACLYVQRSQRYGPKKMKQHIPLEEISKIRPFSSITYIDITFYLNFNF